MDIECLSERRDVSFATLGAGDTFALKIGEEVFIKIAFDSVKDKYNSVNLRNGTRIFIGDSTRVYHVPGKFVEKRKKAEIWE